MTPSNATRTPQRVYLDHAARTPMSAGILDCFIDACRRFPANPLNVMSASGREAHRAIEGSREVIADCLGAHPDEIIFTSGATESNNLALFGLSRAHPGHKLVTATTEHLSVLESCRALALDGARVQILPTDARGRIELDRLRGALDGPAIVSLMWVNNETGALRDVLGVTHILSEREGALFHCDATQAVGRVRVRVDETGVDAMSFSGHKLGGPPGVGALYLRRGVPIEPIFAGGHGRGPRPGTPPTPSIIAFAEACRQATGGLDAHARHAAALTERFCGKLLALDLGVEVITPSGYAAPGILSVAFRGVEAESLLNRLTCLDLSMGSACTAGTLEPSHVIAALGVEARLQLSVVRFSFGRQTTAAELDFALDALTDEVRFQRALSPHQESSHD